MKNNKLKSTVIALGMTLLLSPTAVNADEVTSPAILPTESIQLFDKTETIFSYDDQAVVPAEFSIAPRLSFDTFYGGVTGLPGLGTVWGEFHPRSRSVIVRASGKRNLEVSARPGQRAFASVPRAFSGNTSGWRWQ